MQVTFDAARFDEVVHSGLPEGGDIELVIKESATQEKRPALAITFTVELPDGTFQRAQAVCTLRAFLTTAKLLGTKYPECLPS